MTNNFDRLNDPKIVQISTFRTPDPEMDQNLTDDDRVSTSSHMDVQAERDRTDAKIEAAEARTDTKILRFEALMREAFNEAKGAREEAVKTREDAKATRSVVVTTAIATFLALGALIIGMASYGASQFYNGTVLRDLIHQVTTK